MTNNECQECGETLTGQQTKFCSTKCRVRDYRARNPEREKELREMRKERARDAMDDFDEVFDEMEEWLDEPRGAW